MQRTYKAGHYAGTGGPEVVEIARRTRRAAKRGEVLVEVEASAVSASDAMVRKGVVPVDLRAYVPGYDLAGRVVEVGESVDPGWIGKRVIALAVWGGNAELAFVAPHRLMRIPEALDPIAAAASGLNYATALGLLSFVPEGTAFFQGLSGGVGAALLDLSRRYPKLALAGTSRPGTEARAEGYGAAAWAYDDPELAAKTARRFPEGFDVVFDPFGGPRRRDMASLVKPTGRLIGFGFGGRTIFGYQANVLSYALGRRMSFFSIRALERRSPSEFARILGVLEGLIARGSLDPLIAGVYPLDDLAEAHLRFEQRGVDGKLVIQVKR